MFKPDWKKEIDEFAKQMDRVKEVKQIERQNWLDGKADLQVEKIDKQFRTRNYMKSVEERSKQNKQVQEQKQKVEEMIHRKEQYGKFVKRKLLPTPNKMKINELHE
jgi:hypothetical protein